MFIRSPIRELPKPADSLLIGILLATRDSDPHVARCAFQTLAERSELDLTAPQLQAFTYSIKMALQSSEIALRLEAARVVAKVCQNSKAENETGAMREIENLFTHDVSHSVRAQWR